MKNGFYIRKGIKMRTFFSSTFMEEKSLKEEGIYHPIKLEYYKIVKEETEENEELKFGIKIVKKEYTKTGMKEENEKVEHISNDEKEIEKILNTLEENQVTPVILEYVLKDMNF